MSNDQTRRKRWWNRPGAEARRAEAARKATEGRVVKQAGERADELAQWEGDLQLPERTCPHLDFTPFGERECVLVAGHGPDDDHEAHDGHSWPADDCGEDCGVACGY